MTSPAGSEDALVNEGWRRVTDGPYYAAWRQFWGKDLDFDVLQPWKAWTDALKQYDAHSLEDSVSALARSVLGGETDVHLPSCTFLESPWVDELSETKGRIMFLDDHERIYGRVRDMHAKASHRLEGVIIGGQGGVGKTYLSLYLLARRLAEKKLVFYSPNKSQFFFFDTGGVLERDGFTYSCVFSNPDLRLAVPEDTWIITDTSPVEGEPASGATMGYLFLIQLCRPEDRYFSDWARRNRTESLTLDSWSPSVVLSGALVQCNIRHSKEALSRLLSTVRDFGTCSRYCYLAVTQRVDLYASLRTYIAGLSRDKAAEITRLAGKGIIFPRCLRSMDRTSSL
ncbi:unnamed protein product [Peniophora sp. CBMAI 1063]|nr:unnamed protein product [Peniophora sp. CBMAI 1063]